MCLVRPIITAKDDSCPTMSLPIKFKVRSSFIRASMVSIASVLNTC